MPRGLPRGSLLWTQNNTAGGDGVKINAVVSGTGGITKEGSGIATLKKDNTFAGDVTINDGTLKISKKDGLGNSGSTTTTTVNSGATLRIKGGGIKIVDNEDLILAGTGASSQGALWVEDAKNTGLAWTGTVTLSADATITVDNGEIIDFQGVVGETGGPNALTLEGMGTMTLSGDNTYTGDTIITGGTLLLGASNRISDSSDLQLGGGTFNTGGFSETLGTLTLTADSVIDMGAGSSILTFANITDASIGSNVLSIWNWTGTVGSAGGTDQLIFSTNSLTKFDQISFYSDSGTTLLGNGLSTFIGTELVPVPEATSVFASILLCGLAGGHAWRRRKMKEGHGESTACYPLGPSVVLRDGFSESCSDDWNRSYGDGVFERGGSTRL